jgi:hypothetical protein
VLWIAAALVPTAARACDSTCCLLLTRGQSGLVRRGGFQLEFSYRSTSMSARRAGSGSTETVVKPKVFLEEGRLIPGYHEDLEGSDRFLQADAPWGVASSTTIFGSLPLISHRFYQIGHQGAQTSYSPRGIGDLVLGVRQPLVRSPQRSLVASLGVRLPTGKDDLVEVYDSTILDSTLPPGTGSGDVIATLGWSTVGPAKSEVGVSGSDHVNTTNEYDYRFGNLLIGAVTASRPARASSPRCRSSWSNRDRARSSGIPFPRPARGRCT